MARLRTFRIYDCRRGAVALATVLLAGCGGNEGPATSQGSYDPNTGELVAITYDKNNNGRIDTWTRMKGSRALSSEMDTNEDGVIDRWEEYGDRQQLVRAGWIRPRPAAPVVPAFAAPTPSSASPTPTPPPAPDTWLYPSDDGRSHRIDYLDIDNSGNLIVTRREFYVGEAKTRVEEDKDGDGVMDQWESHEGGQLRFAEFDDGHDGKPDRRFTYAKGALVLIETAPDASGAYTRRVVPGGK